MIDESSLLHITKYGKLTFTLDSFIEIRLQKVSLRVCNICQCKQKQANHGHILKAKVRSN